MDNIITQEHIDAYGLYLLADERSAGMISRYRHDLTAFTRWLDGRIGSKETAAGWKNYLSHCGYAPRTINSMLAAVNGFCRSADQAQIFEHPAADFSGQRPRADEGGVRPPSRRRAGERSGTPRPHHGNALRHGHSRVRASLYHRGGGTGGTGHHHPQGQDSCLTCGLILAEKDPVPLWPLSQPLPEDRAQHTHSSPLLPF